MEHATLSLPEDVKGPLYDFKFSSDDREWDPQLNQLCNMIEDTGAN
jgi:hypothetical protein